MMNGYLVSRLGIVTTVFCILITVVRETTFYSLCVFWARICWQVVLRWCWHTCYKRNWDRNRSMHPSQVLKTNPSFFFFQKPEHRSDKCASWGLCRVPSMGLAAPGAPISWPFVWKGVRRTGVGCLCAVLWTSTFSERSGLSDFSLQGSRDLYKPSISVVHLGKTFSRFSVPKEIL